MANSACSLGARVLILAPTGRDAESVSNVLSRRAIPHAAVGDLAALAQRIGDDAGAIVLTEEALLRADAAPLAAALNRQPKWSSLPFVFLTAKRQSSRLGPSGPRLPINATNVITLERPLGAESLLSAVQWALAARQRQFELRDQWHELQQSEQRLRQMADAMPQLVWSATPDGAVDYYNERCSEYQGLEQSTGAGWSWQPVIHPDDLPRTIENWEYSRATGEDFTCEHRLKMACGKWEWHVSRAVGARDVAGRVVKWYGTATNVHELKQAEQALVEFNTNLEAKVAERTAELEAAMEQRQRTEEALRQSQKMDAVGQLTGGIAHDFNNMLTGIIGSLEMMKRRLGAGRIDDLGRFMEAAHVSAQRAASLTHRLLAFSRRQSLNDKPIDVNELVQSLEDFLRRSLGERIELRIHTAAQLPAARADASQLESALVNLAINARDAMPDGGRLTIVTELVNLDRRDPHVDGSLHPGAYVALSVRDTGVGMTPDTLSKAFDPFFTTKPIGQGTGLGLSMVYGFARQSGGDARISSVPGRGTTVELLLPLAGEDAGDAVGTAPIPPTGRGERVLVVEDEPAVRMLVREVLDELGYAAEEARDSSTALGILLSQKRVDLLISDVGLPGMNGRQLAEQARQHRPDLKVLFVTGYAEHAAARSSFLEPGMDLIVKPFTFDGLAVKIREMIA
jgi:PAS domain S-box-containing protein